MYYETSTCSKKAQYKLFCAEEETEARMLRDLYEVREERRSDTRCTEQSIMSSLFGKHS